MSVHNLTEIAQLLSAELKGDGACEISSLASLEHAKNGQISFLSNPRFRDQLIRTKASAVIVAPNELEHCPANALVMDDPYLGFAKIAALFQALPEVYNGIHESAIVDETATIANNVSIGANVVIEQGVIIADNVVIGPGCVIGANTTIGKGTRLWANVTVYYGVTIGQECIIHSGVVIGADGFGLVKEHGRWQRIPQLGGVTIGDFVDIGANTTIDRGAIDDTVIAEGAKLDNQIQIAHNVYVGKNTAIAGCVGIAGSTHIGNDCMIAGGVGINGHINIADNVFITAMTSVAHSITEQGVYSSGMPAQPSALWRKKIARLNKIDKLAKTVAKIQKQLENQE